jgi:hypothetical protein
MKSKLLLIVMGFVQVFFVSVNTYFLAKEIYLGVVIAAFSISFVWSFNVKKVAFGSNSDRILYSLGAMSGSVFGLYSSSWLITILKGF